MKRILPLLFLCLALAAPSVWGGGCDSPSCQNSPELPAPDPLGLNAASKSVESVSKTRSPKVLEFHEIVKETPTVTETCDGDCQGPKQTELETLPPETKSVDGKGN
jgi:hypothetical protein